MLLFLGIPRIFRLQLQFFSRCCVGINNCCNVTRSFTGFIFSEYNLGPAKRSPTIRTVRRTRAIKRGFMQLKGARFLLQGPRFPVRGHRFPLQPLRSPYGGPFYLSDCRSQFPGSNCIGPLGASKNVGLDSIFSEYRSSQKYYWGLF